MQLTFEIDDSLAQEFFALVPEAKRSFYLSELLAKQLSYKPNPHNDKLSLKRQLPFEPFVGRGIVVSNELVNQIRDKEGI